jgi:hypothetical protein
MDAGMGHHGRVSNSIFGKRMAVHALLLWTGAWLRMRCFCQAWRVFPALLCHSELLLVMND